MAKPKYGKWLKPENLVLIQGWKRNGLTDEQIAKNMGIAPRTLENWKKDHIQILHALKVGKQHANFLIENQLFKEARNGNITAMIFYLKNNWRDKYNDSQLSQEEREVRKWQAKRAKAEADIMRYKADLLTNPDKIQDKTIIVDDIPKVDEVQDDKTDTRN